MFFRKKREVIFFRHGETSWNKANLIQGRTDIYLNVTGIEQADKLGHILKQEKLDFVLSSPLRRAKTTAKIVLDVINKPHNLMCTEQLVERNFGVLEGCDINEVLEEYKEIFDIMDDNSHPECMHATFPESESKFDVLDRVFDCTCNFMNSNTEYKKIGISCHGGILRYINLFVNKKITGYGNCDYIKVDLKDLEKYNKKLQKLAREA